MAECCCESNEKKRNVLLYACSGGANVAEIADRAARQLSRDGLGGMFCLAGLGADIPGMVQGARDADLNLLIDGCPLDCAKKTFDRHGLDNYCQVKVTDLGIEKAKGVPCSDEQIAMVVAHCRALLDAKD
jgi:uncharacterized metal-binding protein